MRRISIGSLVLLGIFLALTPSAQTTPGDEFTYDLVVRNGKIVDGTGNPWFHGDLAIKGDKIAVLGKIPGKGKREIDAKGLIVAPGFIDMHSHSDFTLFE